MNPSRETKFSGTHGDRGMFIFPVQLTTSRIGNLTRLIHTLLHVMTIHTYIHTYYLIPGSVFCVTVWCLVCTVCVCVLSSHLFWTSGLWTAGNTQEEGHTGFLIHLPSAVLALIFPARRIQPFLSLVNREVKFCVLTMLIVLHFFGIFGGGRGGRKNPSSCGDTEIRTHVPTSETFEVTN